VLALVVASFAGTLVLLDRFVVPAFATMYKEFGGALPKVTPLVLSHVAPLGGALLALVLAGLGVFSRRRGSDKLGLGLLLGAISLAIATVAFCFYALYAPMFELSSKIKA